MAYQFVHIETYARKADRHGRSVEWVLDEAERKEGSCPHVARPRPAEVIHGMALANVRRAHDEAAASLLVTLANGKTRALRKDQKTLVTVVASHPATIDEVRANPAVAADVAAWERRTVEWLVGQYGDSLLSVVRHTDEAHAHLHAYVLPGDLRGSRLHPGVEAKRAVVETGVRTGENGKALNRRGDAAYKAALREWQDSYWRDVGLPSGLTRLGPARRRLTRAEWHAERVACQAVKEATEQAAGIEQRAESLRTEAEANATRVKAQAQETFSHAHRKARETVKAARVDAGRILSSARSEAERLRSLGGRLRRLWDGLRHSSIRDAVRRDFAVEVARLKAHIDRIAERLNGETQKRQEAEQRAAEAYLSARAVGRNRDRLRRELNAMRPMPEVGIRPDFKPTRRGS